MKKKYFKNANLIGTYEALLFSIADAFMFCVKSAKTKQNIFFFGKIGSGGNLRILQLLIR